MRQPEGLDRAGAWKAQHLLESILPPDSLGHCAMRDESRTPCVLTTVSTRTLRTQCHGERSSTRDSDDLDFRDRRRMHKMVEVVARLLSHQEQWAACRVRRVITHTVRHPDTQVSSTLLFAERSFPSYRTSLGTQTKENRYAPTIVPVFGRRKRPQAVTSHGIGAQPGITVTRHLPQSCPATPWTRTVS